MDEDTTEEPDSPSDDEPPDSYESNAVTEMPWKRSTKSSQNTTEQASSQPSTPVDEDSSPEAEISPPTDSVEAATKSDGGTLSEDTIGPSPDISSTDDDALVPSGPSEDQEMPLSAHIEEMVRRVLVVVVVMSIVSAATFPFAVQLVNGIWYGILTLANASTVQPHVYHPLATVLARLKVATLAGFVIALPVFVYETYLFMRPGLYPRERRYYIAAIPTSLVLATAGVAFAFFIVLPIIFIYFLGYTQGTASIAFGLSDTFGLMLLLMGFFALIFQIPLFIMLAVMMGVTSRSWLTQRRLYFWGGFLGLAFITNPDPTGMAPIIVTVSMIILFEATLLLLKWTKSG